MKILFLTLIDIESIDDRGIYQDLLRDFIKKNHQVFVVSPYERKLRKETTLLVDKGDNVSILKVKTFNIQKTNILEKGLGTIAIEYQYLSAIKKYFSKEKFDIIVYSTPPITFYKVINHIKNRDGAVSYLLLKDIFPQNAVDLGLMNKKRFVYKIFRKKEIKLYEISDYIGCMSEGNRKYILTHNPFLNPSRIEVNPNSIEINDKSFLTDSEKTKTRELYNLPTHKKIFVYGGNLGKPQGLDFLLEIIQFEEKNENAFFLIIGGGTEFTRIQKWFDTIHPTNAKLMGYQPKHIFDSIVASCDVGMIFLNPNFTIPNFPSRLLSYLEFGLPVMAATDAASDVGDVLEINNCGYKVISGDLEGFHRKIEILSSDNKLVSEMQKNAKALLLKNYNVGISTSLIIDKLKK
jgi:glycosyltransferase involved in cell wall biosynthesis